MERPGEPESGAAIEETMEVEIEVTMEVAIEVTRGVIMEAMLKAKIKRMIKQNKIIDENDTSRNSCKS